MYAYASNFSVNLVELHERMTYLHVIFVDVLSALQDSSIEVQSPASNSLLRRWRQPVVHGTEDGDVTQQTFLPDLLVILALQVLGGRLNTCMNKTKLRH